MEETRVGIGYDVHRLVAGRPLVLGGVTIPAEWGLEGHSDADVAIHAIMDALLGAAALGDIGGVFPPGDPATRGADSRELLRAIAARVRDAGFIPGNIDVTVVAERPRIAARVAEMRAAIAAAVGVEPDCVGVKGTTNEGLDAVGRGEAVAAHAVALLVQSDAG